MRKPYLGLSIGVVLVAGCGDLIGGEEPSQAALLEPRANSAGVGETFHTSGSIDRTNPFFESMGTNGRTCETCHDARSAWTTSAKVMTELFESTAGTHPLFVSLHDSGIRPDAPTGNLNEKRDAFKTLLEFGVHRFTRTGHVGNDYDVIAVDNPWGWSTTASFANFRRAGTNMGNVTGSSSTTTTERPTGHSRAARRSDERRDGVPRPDDGAGPDRKARRGCELHARPVVRPVDRQRRRGAGHRGRPGRTGQPGGGAVPGCRPLRPLRRLGRCVGDGPGAGHACSMQNRQREQIARGQGLFNTCSSRFRAWPA